ncbi:uncharacterized protein DDB_G0283357-like [Teleopsis dalmanni]|uniref:uncharacterized protein DDB_G0283357-like n=1 Tax=Teleopsis dalmanni TaxID=139649 RepID=UPI0018CF990A|nr:uncharacterized protein DDB_G0283357-like [Teleopsis dalmanni]XP_037935190.1 uncharacterized protein DDB_G0283357-like [Teleopsis dalmanni]XP_037935191.1 uncharacterized protein DDB_G0283357-like [Teleopsis dalmanni]
MATKTVINTTKIPQTRGISIIIDPDQQVVNCKQQQQHQLESSKIIIFHNSTANTITTTTTTSTKPLSSTTELTNETRSAEKVGPLYETLLSTKSPATLKTFIDINRKHNNDDHNNEVNKTHNDINKVHNDKNNNEEYVQEILKETGYSATPHLLLRVVSDPHVAERGKIYENVAENSQKTVQLNSETTANTVNSFNIEESSKSHNLKIGIGGEHEPKQKSNTAKDVNGDNGYNGDDEVLTSKKIIIKCNNEDEDENEQQTSTNNASNDVNIDDYAEYRTKQSEESLHISVGSTLIDGDSENGKLSGGSVRIGDSLQQLQLQPHVEQHQHQHQQQQQHQEEQLENVTAVEWPNSLTTKADCVSALTTEKDSHVVKIQIKSNHLKTVNATKSDTKIVDAENNTKFEKQVTVVKLNELNDNFPNKKNTNTENTSAELTNNDINLNIEKMVQKPAGAGNIGTHAQNSISSGGGLTTGNTTVTELNVTNPSYLYYMMSSGQFSPCDTLDSGTGSDLESNGNSSNITLTTGSAKIVTTSNISVVDGAGIEDTPPKIEMHLKTTKIRIHKDNKSKDKQNRISSNEHQRAGSLTDSEESESSLSCDSLHSTEFIRQTSVSPTSKAAAANMLASYLPDSLLRDIRDRKFPTNDFEDKYGNGLDVLELKSNDDYAEIQKAVECIKQEQELERNTASNHATGLIENNKRASFPNKTFIINADDGIFVDTKMNSMPRKYEADKYYNFHVHEHENFRSFGNNNSNVCDNLADDTISLSEYEVKSVNDDAFAGYKDIRCGSTTSTIRSSKGTVRGVKNRVRNGIATFLQLQQPNVKFSVFKNCKVRKLICESNSHRGKSQLTSHNSINRTQEIVPILAHLLII